MDRLQQLQRLPPRELALSAAAAAAIMGTAVWCIRDYQDFLALGPGGAAYNLKGWAWVTSLRPFALSKQGALQTSSYPTDGAHEEIKDLPSRAGPRASVGGIIPHRQLSQHPPKDVTQYITNLFKNAVVQNSDLLQERLSLYEKHNPALFVHDDIFSSSDSSASETARISRGEIGHVHPDYSIHLYFSPADARHIIAKGWGEKHRLSKPKTSIFQFQKYGLSDTYIMIYGPRTEEEIETVSKILQNSIRFMTGRTDVQLPQWRTALGTN
ncbi:hypothetical protein H2200_005773 [Cladophialophora chaetospira]|uniref:Luciferase domain-containing protein n=1 Tax=Cladophialophora chaetospira TaxID=386627 RepID=A0AA38X9T9_9EURO|nr:hypothetical protein H2200_005773 [Cladophialophora chaetospira]